ncbi:MAG: hypothetical protein AAGN64_10980 [Bacteroidota bacterium]
MHARSLHKRPRWRIRPKVYDVIAQVSQDGRSHLRGQQIRIICWSAPQRHRRILWSVWHEGADLAERLGDQVRRLMLDENTACFISRSILGGGIVPQHADSLEGFADRSVAQGRQRGTTEVGGDEQTACLLSFAGREHVVQTLDVERDFAAWEATTERLGKPKGLRFEHLQLFVSHKLDDLTKLYAAVSAGCPQRLQTPFVDPALERRLAETEGIGHLAR